jgi:hypothetical protein
MPTLKANTPAIRPADDAAVYPDMWLTNMQIDAQNPNGKVSIRGRLVPSRTLEDGSKAILRGRGVPVNISDVFAVIEANPTGAVAQAFSAIMLALIEQVPELDHLA